jgi:hypothetical protein
MEQVASASQTIGKIIYEEVARKSAAGQTAGEGATAGATAGASSENKGDDVIDAEFEEKK